MANPLGFLKAEDEDLGFKPVAAPAAPPAADLGFVPDQEEDVNFEPEPDLEGQRLAQQRAKAAAQQAQVTKAVAQRMQAEDPANWTIEEAQKRFKAQPARSPQEAAQREAFLKQKKLDQDRVVEQAQRQAILLKIKAGQELSSGERELYFSDKWHSELTPAPPTKLLTKVLQRFGRATGVTPSPEFLRAKAQNTLAIAQLTGKSPNEIESKYEQYALDPRITGMQHDPTNIETLHKVMTPMVVTAIAGDVATMAAGKPPVVIPTLAAFGLLEKFLPIQDKLNQLVNNNQLSPEMRDGLVLLDFALKGKVAHTIGKPVGARVLPKGLQPVLQRWLPKPQQVELGLTPPEEVKPAEAAAAGAGAVEVGRQLSAKEAGKPAVSEAITSEMGKQFPVTPNPDLPAAERPIETAAFRVVTTDPKTAVDEYLAKNGNIINPDAAKEQFAQPLGVDTKTLMRHAPAVHEPGSLLAKLAQERLMETRRGQGNNTVLMLAGGSGAGKTAVAKRLMPTDEYALTLDKTFSSVKSAVRDIEQSLANGYDVEFKFVLRDPLEAWRSERGGVMTRAEKTGRIVPLEQHLRNHQGAIETAKRIANEYGADERVDIQLFDNRGAAPEDTHTISLEELGQLRYDWDGIRAEAQDAIHKAVRQGRTSEALQRALLEGTREPEGGAEPGPGRTLEPAAAEPLETRPTGRANLEALARVVVARTQAQGGATLSIRGGTPPDGYVVAVLKGNERPMAAPELAVESVVAYLREHETTLQQSNHFIGSWIDEQTGRLVLDTPIVVAEQGRAVEYGRATLQDAIWDLANQKEIRLDEQNLPGVVRPAEGERGGVRPAGEPEGGAAAQGRQGPAVGESAARAPANPPGEPVEPTPPAEPAEPGVGPATERKFITTVRESERTAPEVAGAVESVYEPLANKTALAEARRLIDADPDAAQALVEGPETPTAVSNATAILLIDRAQSEGRWTDAIRLVERTAEKQTALGQAIQALSIYNRLSPEGILRYTDKVIREAQKKMPQAEERLAFFERKAKGLNDVERAALAKKLGIPFRTPALMAKLRSMAEAIDAMPDGRAKSIQTALMLKELSSVVPKSLWRKVAMVQTMAQLINPKTFIRNLLGNVGFAALENTSESLAAVLDAAVVSRFTGERAVGRPLLGEQARGFAQGLREGAEEARLGIDLKKITTKLDLPRDSVFDTGVMGALEKTLRMELQAVDRAFYQAAFNQSLRQQTRLAGIEEPTAEMIERAHLEGLYRTFQDKNVVTKVLTKLKKALNAGGDFGLGDMVIKYPGVPGALISRGIEYSPFGFLNTVHQLSKPLFGRAFNQQAFSRSTARALTGSTLLFGTGFILGKLGIVSGREPTRDRDVRENKQLMGLRDYQLNVSALKRFAASGWDPEQAARQEGDTLINYDWFQPSVIPLELGADLALAPTGQSKTEKLLNLGDKLIRASETLEEQPVLQGVRMLGGQETLAEGVSKVLAGVPASFVPTILNQVRQLMDNTARNTKDPNYFSEVYKRAAYRVPGLSGTLPEAVTPLGETRSIYQFDSNNPFNVFLNPAFVNLFAPDPIGRMVLDIYETSGETIHFPRVAAAKIKVGPEQLELTPEQYTGFQRYIGEKTHALFSILAASEEFRRLSPEVQAKKLQGFLTDIHTAAKIEVLGYRPKRVDADVKTILRSLGVAHRQVQQEDEAAEPVGFVPEE